MSITKFGWEDSGAKVKVMIVSGVDGIGKIPSENVTCDFLDQSFDLRIQNLNGKNYRLRVPEL